MGLDAVEIILRTEEVFCVDLPDDECAQVVAVRDLYALVLRKHGLPEQNPHEIEELGVGQSRLRGRSHLIRLEIGTNEPWNPPDVWRTVVAIIQDQLQVDLHRITPNARFAYDLGCD